MGVNWDIALDGRLHDWLDAGPPVRWSAVMATPDRFEREVAAGAGFLDAILRAPEWRPRIDLGCLHLASARQCVLGQLFGHYATGVEKLGITPEQEFGLGFALTSAVQRLYANPWTALDEAWRRELTRA